uniref:Taste receptor type 2 n=1 Tax=Salvator merianae TaxID=96440 RepID=A0A8D0BMG7_SALMN
SHLFCSPPNSLEHFQKYSTELLDQPELSSSTSPILATIDMPLTKIITFLTAVADFVFCGLLSNGFITAAIISEWAKSRSLAACEQLLLSLGISNIFSTILLIMYLFISETKNGVTKTLMFQLYKGFTIHFTFIRYWLTAWLCVFYCIKILNSTHPFFLWWKMRISRLVLRLIAGSCVISFVASFFIALHIPKQFQSNETAIITNITQEENMGELWKGSRNFFFVIGSSCPLIIVFLCSVVVVVSLCRHICQMTSKGSNFMDLQTEAHVKAARTVLFLLALYISFYVTHTLNLVLNLQKDQISFQVCFIVMLMYSPVQAAILVLSNPKLKQTVSRMLARTIS